MYLWLQCPWSKCHRRGIKFHRGIMHQTQQQWFHLNNQQRQMTKHEATWCKSQATVMLVRLYKNKLRGAMWPKLYGNLSIKWPLFVSWRTHSPFQRSGSDRGTLTLWGELKLPCQISNCTTTGTVMDMHSQKQYSLRLRIFTMVTSLISLNSRYQNKTKVIW